MTSGPELYKQVSKLTQVCLFQTLHRFLGKLTSGVDRVPDLSEKGSLFYYAKGWGLNLGCSRVTATLNPGHCLALSTISPACVCAHTHTHTSRDPFFLGFLPIRNTRKLGRGHISWDVEERGYKIVPTLRTSCYAVTVGAWALCLDMMPRWPGEQVSLESRWG